MFKTKDKYTAKFSRWDSTGCMKVTRVGDVEIEIDIERVVSLLAKRALGNNSRKASVLHGLAKATVIGNVHEER